MTPSTMSSDDRETPELLRQDWVVMIGHDLDVQTQLAMSTVSKGQQLSIGGDQRGVVFAGVDVHDANVFFD